MEENQSRKWIRRTILIIICLSLTIVNSPFYVKAATQKLEVYFLDVGQADATLILCDGKSMLIDGGNVEFTPKPKTQ